jgi:protein PsiE
VGSLRPHVTARCAANSVAVGQCINRAAPSSGGQCKSRPLSSLTQFKSSRDTQFFRNEPLQFQDSLNNVQSTLNAGELMPIKKIIDVTEKVFLVTIALFTVGAMVQEVMLLIEQRSVALKDLLLMFIYAEVLGMLGAFYSSHRIPITIPLVIAMTALSRLIILQGKDGDPSILLYESGAILMIAIACWVISKIQDRD